VHGSAPDIAGRGIANPTSTILSASMMLDWLGEKYDDRQCRAAARSIDDAIIKTMTGRIITPDLGGNCTTQQFAEAVVQRIRPEVI